MDVKKQTAVLILGVSRLRRIACWFISWGLTVMNTSICNVAPCRGLTPLRTAMANPNADESKGSYPEPQPPKPPKPTSKHCIAA